jgi:ATP-dependent DNA helicase 2 subunit 2
LSDVRNPTEYLRPEDTYSPLVHRISQVIGYRAVHPDDPIPPPIDILTQFSHPPADLIKGSDKVQQKLIETFNVKKGSFIPTPVHCSVLMVVPPRKLAKRKKIDEVKPISGLDIEALLLKGKEAEEAGERAKRQKVEIGLDNPSEDFKRLIENEENSWRPGPLPS